MLNIVRRLLPAHAAAVSCALCACRFVDAPAALGYAALHLAVGHGHRSAVEALLYGGANPRVRCLGRMFSTYLMPQRFKPAATPLHIAAVRGDLGICVCLLQFQVLVAPSGRCTSR